ncbi:MAG: TRC40/GET3/ArsA family transport-energizing ATPase [Clostridia bacterium]|nr:TRC40/GET3/ArsA family transport-energizing ATPase [Clostridia bacterium]
MADATKFFFFSGKGGVGKTSMASATAVFYAETGAKTLIVTTDPASNLADVFEQPIGHKVTPVNGVQNLWAMEIDSVKATAEYKDRALAPYRELFDDSIVAVMEEQLNSPCTEEMASFDKFVDFIDNPEFEVVVFDTAPTGHTIRLLELPVDWSRHIAESEQGSGQTCLGPVQVLQDSRAKYDRAIAILQDPNRTTFAFVVQPEATPIKETERSAGELARIGINSNLLIINGILPPEHCRIPFFQKRSQMQQEYLKVIAARLKLPAKKVYLLEEEIKGLDFLRHVGRRLWSDTAEQPGSLSVEQAGSLSTEPSGVPEVTKTINPNVQQLLVPQKGQTRSVFFAGKGGVGKTSVSCITAVWLAKQGVKTLLITTDPAAHIGEVLQAEVRSEPTAILGVANLWAAKIDPKQTAEAYKNNILDDARTRYSEEVITIMEEQLDSPCTEEMAVFNKFMDYVLRSDYEVMVFDTAPTGHTLRLLELPMDWSKQIELKSSTSVEGDLLNKQAMERFEQVIGIMRDPARATFGFVVYPENTPIMEAHRAVEELKTVGINTPLVVANLVLPGEFCINSFFQQRRRMQERHLSQLAAKFSGAAVLQLPVLDREIKGMEMLEKGGDILFAT